MVEIKSLDKRYLALWQEDQTNRTLYNRIPRSSIHKQQGT